MNTARTTIRLIGGIGNQLFQLMSGLFYASERNTSLIVDESWLTKGYSHNQSNWRDVRIDLSKDIKVLDSSNNMMFPAKKVAARFARLQPALAQQIGCFQEVSPVGASLNVKNLVLYGNYQTPFYYDYLKENLNLRISLKKPSHDYLQIEKTLRSNSVAMHIRGGDYLQKSHIYRKLDALYFQSAIDKICERVGKVEIAVFTDDLKRANEIIQEISINPIEIYSKKLLPAEELFLMSKFRNLICSNSTFSYWSGLLGEKSNLVVIPRNWYVNEESTLIQNIPRSWISV